MNRPWACLGSHRDRSLATATRSLRELLRGKVSNHRATNNAPREELSRKVAGSNPTPATIFCTKYSLNVTFVHYPCNENMYIWMWEIYRCIWLVSWLMYPDVIWVNINIKLLSLYWLCENKPNKINFPFSDTRYGLKVKLRVKLSPDEKNWITSPSFYGRLAHLINLTM